MQECQEELHKWGRANQVVLDASKDSMHILSRHKAQGDPAILLGVKFDCSLIVSESVMDLEKRVREARFD